MVEIGPFPQWSEPGRIVSLDPWGHASRRISAQEIGEGVDIRPTIAITKARLTMSELNDAVVKGRLKVDGTIVKDTGEVAVTKAAVEPVWYLPGIAERFGVKEDTLRRTLFEQTGGMYPELVTRPDLSVFLPPIGGITLYIFGDPSAVWDKRRTLACRVHDECNGSDVFGSDICTCRPYLIHGIEECIREAQNGGAGLIVYNRKEGRALGEVTKFLVYNARKRQEGGDQAATYFERTECVAGVQDARFQQLMPDVLHWLGVTQHRPFRLDVEHEVRCDDGLRHRDRRARADPGRADPGRCQGRDGGEEGRWLFLLACADRRRTEGDGRPQHRGILDWAMLRPRVRCCRQLPSASVRTKCSQRACAAILRTSLSTSTRWWRRRSSSPS